MYYDYRLFGCTQSDSLPNYGNLNKRKNQTGVLEKTFFLPALYDILDFSDISLFLYTFIPRFRFLPVFCRSERFSNSIRIVVHSSGRTPYIEDFCAP